MAHLGSILTVLGNLQSTFLVGSHSIAVAFAHTGVFMFSGTWGSEPHVLLNQVNVAQ